MRALHRITAVLGTAVLLALLGLSGPLACDRKEGPMEEAGEALDDAADDVEDELDDMTE
ncbi:MAG TPA: hypothetical protein VIN04_13155 [Myxococcota bacterium]|jgi:hypothetical protein